MGGDCRRRERGLSTEEKEKEDERGFRCSLLSGLCIVAGLMLISTTGYSQLGSDSVVEISDEKNTFPLPAKTEVEIPDEKSTISLPAKIKDCDWERWEEEIRLGGRVHTTVLRREILVDNFDCVEKSINNSNVPVLRVMELLFKDFRQKLSVKKNKHVYTHIPRSGGSSFCKYLLVQSNRKS